MPANEQLVAFAAHGTTMALFLSVRRPRELQRDLVDGGYPEDTPCAVVYRASWPDEIVIRCPLAELGDRVRGARITTQALVLVGPALGAAAALGQELTVPDVSQSLILTRRAQRTSMPANEQLAAFAAHGTTMALFLSVRRPRELQRDLVDGGYPDDTPCAVVYRASWPDEIVIRCPLAELGDRVREARITTQALVLVGPALGAAADAGRSHVYDPGYGHRHRPLGRPDRYRRKA
jgi:precorrin-4 methylase